MGKKSLFYLIAFALLVANLLFFNNAYRELMRYTDLTNRATGVQSSFQNLSRLINNAAVIHPDLMQNENLSGDGKIFFADSSSVCRELLLLRSTVVDSVNISIADKLNTGLRSELPWLLKSNVPDSIIHHQAVDHIIAFRAIDSLIAQGIKRTGFLIEYRKQLQATAIDKVKRWMIVFILLSAILLLYALYQQFRQRTRNENRFRILTENNTDIIAIMDKDMYPFYRSPSAERITGYTEADRKKGIKAEIHPDDMDLIRGCTEKLFLSPGEAIPATYRIKNKNGEYIWLEGYFKNLLHEPGLRGIVANMRDVTDQKKSHVQQVLLESIVNSSEDAIISKTIAGEITSWNPGAEKMFGYSAQEMIGKNITTLIPSYLLDEEKDILDRISKKQSVKHYETERIKKDGSIINVSLSVSPILDANKNLIGASKIIRDITQRKKAEKIIEAANLEKNIILESIDDAFFAVDKNWNVLYWNHRAEKSLKVLKSDIIGRNLWEIFSGSIDSVSYINYHRAIAENTVIRFEDFFAPLDSWFDISAYPSETGLSVYFKDITSRKLSELQLTALNKRLEKKAKELAVSNADLEQFAYIASHDLQEPLRMVTGFLSQIEKKYADLLDEDGKIYIDFAVDGAKRMKRIILDLLDFSRIGRVEEKYDQVNMNDLLVEIKNLYSKEITEKKAIFIIDDLPVIRTLKMPVYRVFQNLVGNALKYTQQNVIPQIRISATEKNNCVEFAVTDNGMGINEAYYDKIFLIFQRLNAKDGTGTGIGLAICKKIAEQLGGNIRVESTEGKGSTFYFTIPE